MYLVGNRSFNTWDQAAEYCISVDFDPDLMIQEEKSIYWYEYRLRGFSPGCQPKGFIDVNHNLGKFGYIAYDRRLTEQELNEYELREVE